MNFLPTCVYIYMYYIIYIHIQVHIELDGEHKDLTGPLCLEAPCVSLPWQPEARCRYLRRACLCPQRTCPRRGRHRSSHVDVRLSIPLFTLSSPSPCLHLPVSISISISISMSIPASLSIWSVFSFVSISGSTSRCRRELANALCGDCCTSFGGAGVSLNYLVVFWTSKLSKYWASSDNEGLKASRLA